MGARGPDHAQVGPLSLCLDLHAGEPPALHGVKTGRFSSAPADSLSSGLISKTSLFTEEKSPFTPGCAPLLLITAGRVSPRAPGPVAGTTSPQTTLLLCGEEGQGGRGEGPGDASGLSQSPQGDLEPRPGTRPPRLLGEPHSPRVGSGQELGILGTRV